jgi:hypothetical protein
MKSFNLMKHFNYEIRVLAFLCLGFFVTCSVSAEDSFFDDLNVTAASSTAEVATGISDKILKIGSYEVKGEGKVVSHNYFERDLDAPPFYNFESSETNILTGMSKVNGGTCFGISMVTIRYFQWFILPSLIDDKALSDVRGKKLFGFGKPNSERKLPSYAKQMAKDFGLPSWMLSWPEGSQANRTKKIAPYRMRTLLSQNLKLAKKVQVALTGEVISESVARLDPELAKEHAIRMFDNQMGLMRKGAQLYEMLSKKTHEYGNSESKTFQALFGRCAFDAMLKSIDDCRLGCNEIGFWGSKLKPMWGHSVVAWKVTLFEAVNASGEPVKAYKVDIYDNNDPFNTSDNAFWYFSDVQKFSPSAAYADYYDGDSPLLPAGKEFLNAIQMGPSSEGFALKFEENLMNKFSKRFEKVKVQD